MHCIYFDLPNLAQFLQNVAHLVNPAGQ